MENKEKEKEEQQIAAYVASLPGVIALPMEDIPPLEPLSQSRSRSPSPVRSSSPVRSPRKASPSPVRSSSPVRSPRKASPSPVRSRSPSPVRSPKKAVRIEPERKPVKPTNIKKKGKKKAVNKYIFTLRKSGRPLQITKKGEVTSRDKIEHEISLPMKDFEAILIGIYLAMKLSFLPTEEEERKNSEIEVNDFYQALRYDGSEYYEIDIYYDFNGSPYSIKKSGFKKTKDENVVYIKGVNLETDENGELVDGNRVIYLKTDRDTYLDIVQGFDTFLRWTILKGKKGDTFIPTYEIDINVYDNNLKEIDLDVED